MWDQIVDFLRRQRYAVISTVDGLRGPESALVGVAWWQAADGVPQLIFDTTTATRKAKNLAQDPRCSVVIGWEHDTTVQLEGNAVRLQGAELDIARLDYFSIWPECRAHESWPDIAYYSVQPRWLRYSCYLNGPLIVELEGKQLASELRNYAPALIRTEDRPQA